MEAERLAADQSAWRIYRQQNQTSQAGRVTHLGGGVLAAASVCSILFSSSLRRHTKWKNPSPFCFENRSEDKSNAYFTDGVQDENSYSPFQDWGSQVISRASTQRYKNTSQNLSEIANQLGVANLLEGSVQKTNDQVRVMYN